VDAGFDLSRAAGVAAIYLGDDLLERGALLEQVPDQCADLVDAVVVAGREVDDDGFAVNDHVNDLGTVDAVVLC
jgi:hypothetical protein